MDLLLEMKSMWEIGLKECQSMQIENTELKLRIEKVEGENKRLSNRLTILEDKLLEGNVIFQGVLETIWESSDTTKEKILTAILHTISGDTAEDHMDQACKVPIKDVKHIGKYIPMCTHPVLVEFYHKSDMDFLLSNRTYLPKGVYFDKQYSEDTEKEHRRLRPILCVARKHEYFQREM